MDASVILVIIPLLLGWIADKVLGDPEHWPHPIVWFGQAIAFGEKRWNKGDHKVLKGAAWSIFLIIAVFVLTLSLLFATTKISIYLGALLNAIIVFYCLSGKTLIREVRQVFVAVDRSVEEGRKQVGRIVGRDTSELSPQEIRAAALETLSENLSDGVIAPLFWFLLLGTPGMFTYKMINTLDSMIGYKNERYREFGRIAAKIDDVANYLPARLTAFIMLLVSNNLHHLGRVFSHGKLHASPNAGYPEAALATILDCRFGGPHNYFGEVVDKPFIGVHDKTFTGADMERAIVINRRSEYVMVALVIGLLALGTVLRSPLIIV